MKMESASVQSPATTARYLMNLYQQFQWLHSIQLLLADAITLVEILSVYVRYNHNYIQTILIDNIVLWIIVNYISSRQRQYHVGKMQNYSSFFRKCTKVTSEEEI